jgi:hypothetical protein
MKKAKVSENGSMTASEMARKRWADVPAEERKEALAKARAHIKLSAKERSEIGRKAVMARWAKARAAEQTAETADEPKPSAASSARGKRKLRRGT